MTTTKAVVINQYGGKEQLTDATVTLPELSAHQVLVKVKATSVNPLDWKLREGYLQQMMPWEFPIILGWDVAGIIEEVGSQVSDWKVGDWVAARPDTTRFGTYAEHTIVDDHLLAKLPEEVSFKDAGALPLAGLTAYQALFTHGKLQAGQKVLIHAGAGGVGTYAIQLAKEAGAYVITTASPKNHQLLKELGADEVIDYHTTDFETTLSEIDLVLDTIAGEVQRKSITVLKPEGRLISLLSIDEDPRIQKKGIHAEAIWLKPNSEELASLVNLMAEKKLKSVIGAEFPLNQAGIYAAHELSETHHAVGKIVLVAETESNAY